MKPTQKHGPKAATAAKVSAKQNQELVASLFAARLDAEDPDDGASQDGDAGESTDTVDADAPEPPQLEDAGDSAVFDDEDDRDFFDRAWIGEGAIMSELPRRLRPQVRYRIAADWSVTPLFKPSLSAAAQSDELERAIVDAVAAHLKCSHVRLEAVGDWCRIPAIGSDSALLALVSTGPASKLQAATLKSIGGVLKDFALELPSGDIVTPQALIHAAGAGKQTTRAAALRLSVTRPLQLPCGETWQDADWARFEDAQRKKRKSGKTAARPRA